jgi:ubiquitin-protein ligase
MRKKLELENKILSGGIHPKILREMWSPVMTVPAVLHTIRSLLTDPGYYANANPQLKDSGKLDLIS